MIRDRFTVMKASFSESLSARGDWVQDSLCSYTKWLPVTTTYVHVISVDVIVVSFDQLHTSIIV